MIQIAINTIIQLTALVTASGDSLANIDIPEDGAIEAIVAHIGDGSLIAGEAVTAELSFLSSNQMTTNDARGLIYSLVLAQGALQTSGASKCSEITSVSFPGGLPVNAGERIHLHAVISGTPSARVSFIMYLSTKGGGRRETKRR